MNPIENFIQNQDSLTRESNTYSGLAVEGLTRSHSYDRMLYTRESQIISQSSEVMELINYCLREFEQGSQSRLLLRLRVDPAVDLTQISQVLTDRQIELASYSEPNNEALRVTIGFNKLERAIPLAAVRQIREIVQHKITQAHQLMPDRNFEAYAVQESQRCAELGLSFANNDFSASELYTLWHESFGWSMEQCEQYASSPQSDNERIFGLRDEEGRLISGMLYSHRESTEWATLPEYQGQGLVVPLLIYANASLIAAQMPEIFAELRFDRSVSAAVKSGMQVHLHPQHQSVLVNQVSIGGDPDSWNLGRDGLGDGTPGEELRSFVIGTVDPRLITSCVRAAFLENNVLVSPFANSAIL
jgi:hypothetical protein